ncbi:hypothetical protein LUZ60_008819 [Juncus effusus]|nr:hypothetical protein LUZ60_008819 [Juncus effusus]
MSNAKKEWKSNVDPHMMSNEELRKTGAESAKRTHGSGEVLHQRKRLPYSVGVMTVGGFFIIAALGYGVLYYQSRPGTSPADVAKATMAPDAISSGDVEKLGKTSKTNEGK